MRRLLLIPLLFASISSSAQILDALPPDTGRISKVELIGYWNEPWLNVWQVLFPSKAFIEEHRYAASFSIIDRPKRSSRDVVIHRTDTLPDAIRHITYRVLGAFNEVFIHTLICYRGDDPKVDPCIDRYNGRSRVVEQWHNELPSRVLVDAKRFARPRVYEYTYDELGRPASRMRWAAKGASLVDIQDQQHPEDTSLYLHEKIRFSYNERGQLDELSVHGPMDAASSYSFRYDRHGNWIKITQKRGRWKMRSYRRRLTYVKE